MTLALLHMFTTLAIGLFAGALLTEACILVPYWRKMEPAEFFRLHSSIGFNLFRYFAPLTAIAVAMSVVSAGLSLGLGILNIWHIIAAGLCLVSIIIFFTYFKTANSKFADHAIDEGQLPAELARWSAWHWFRTTLVLVAFAASILAIM